MVEGRTNTVELPNDNCLAFDLFLQWIDCQTVPEKAADHGAFALMNAWVLADKFCMPVWQNKLIDKLGRCYESPHIKPLHVLWILDRAGEDSNLFKFGRDQLVYDLMFCSSQYKEEWNADLTELLEQWTTLSVFREWILMAGTFWHLDSQGPAHNTRDYHVGGGKGDGEKDRKQDMWDRLLAGSSVETQSLILMNRRS
jgi:hypothetical protein